MCFTQYTFAPPPFKVPCVFGAPRLWVETLLNAPMLYSVAFFLGGVQPLNFQATGVCPPGPKCHSAGPAEALTGTQNLKCLGKWLAHRALSVNAHYYSDNLVLAQAWGKSKGSALWRPRGRRGLLGVWISPALQSRCQGGLSVPASVLLLLRNRRKFCHARDGGVLI